MSSKINYTPSGVSGPEHLERAFGHTSPAQQELYVKLANTAIEKVAAMITTTKASLKGDETGESSGNSGSNVQAAGGGGGLGGAFLRPLSDHSELFYSCLKELSKRRAMIAKITNADIIKSGGDPRRLCDDFGVSRLEKNHTNYEIILGGTYALWRDRNLDYLISKIKHDKALWLACGLKEAEFEEAETAKEEAIDDLNVQVSYDIVPLESMESIPVELTPSITEASTILLQLEGLKPCNKKSKAAIESLNKQLLALDGGIYEHFDSLLHERANMPLEIFRKVAHTLFDNPAVKLPMKTLVMSEELEKKISSAISDKESELRKKLSYIQAHEVIDEVIKAYHQDLIKKQHAMLAAFREVNPPMYRQHKLAQVVHNLRSIFPDVADEPGERCFKHDACNHRTSFLSFQLTYTLPDQAPMPMTRLTTWLDADPALTAEAIFTKMKAHSYVSLFHQDCLDVPKTLSDAGIYFNKAMNWKEEDGIDDLKQHVGCMMYLLAHNHRDVRGTAASSEWLERAIYKSFGLTIASSPDRMPDLLAFTYPDLSAFMREYIASFELEA